MKKIFGAYSESFENLKERVSKVTKELPEGQQARNTYKSLLSMLDMTTLEGSDTVDKVEDLCLKSRFSMVNIEFPDAAAVCVYPSLVRTAKRAVEGSGMAVASVAGGFPSGQTSLKVKLEEVKWAIDEGADEIDMVISRGKLLEGRTSEVFDEVAAIRETCGKTHLKVILETGELPSVEIIRQASVIAIEAGADFIKTSTGKISTGATPEAMLIMLDTIREYLEKTGKSIGIKPAGGIRTAEQALLYYGLVEEVLGADWLDKRYFRIGASSLADALLAELEH